ncbi:MAG: hypothetical protein ACR2PZ_14325 [Pseudomonadales bacterium]
MIGTLNESPLHRALKGHYLSRLDCAVAEAPVGDYVADLLDGQQIYEIQTRGLGSMRHKLEQLLTDFRVVVVHPIASVSVIVKLSQEADGTFSRRRSPKKGQLLNVLDELVSIPELLQHPNFELEVVLVEQELIREYACALRRGRGGWRTIERRLLNLLSAHRFRSCGDLWNLLQEELVQTFGTVEIAQALGSNRAMAQKFAYCMRHAGEIEVVGKQGNSLLYERTGAGARRS